MSKYINADEYKHILHKEIGKMYEFRSAEEIEQNPFDEEKVKAKKEVLYFAITKAMEMPSVEVVRCKDCCYRNKWGECENTSVIMRGKFDRDADYYVDPEFFCADGERKEQNDQ